MAKLEKSKIESYKFYFGIDDEIVIKKGKPYPRVLLGGGRAFFSVDSVHSLMVLDCDWGIYQYRGFPGKEETFKQLLTRLSRGYLIRKISDESEINWGKSKRAANRLIVRNSELTREEKGEGLKVVNAFQPGYDGNEETFYWTVHPYVSDHESSFIVREYPLRAEVAVEIILKYLVPVLEGELSLGSN